MNKIDAEQELNKIVDAEFKKDFDRLLGKMVCMETIRTIVLDILNKHVKDNQFYYDVVYDENNLNDMIDNNEIKFTLVERTPVENIEFSFTIDKDGNVEDIKNE